MKVLKFGGTSVGSVESILNVKKIVEGQSEPVIVVVSALGGVTDKLIHTSQLAVSGNLDYKKSFMELTDRHYQMIDQIIPAGPRKEMLLSIVNALFEELHSIYQGVYLIKDLSAKTQDMIVSYGERISSNIISVLITGSVWYDSRTFIKTEVRGGRRLLASEETNRLIGETFGKLPKIALVPGFISSDVESGETTNLGRGGSDYTASILAAALDASVLEIWTDVDGFMTADPKVISTAYTINELSYVEAMELCNFGAKVVYPPTIYPVCVKNIPIWVKNTFKPEAPGTIIKKEVERDRTGKPICGISSINNTSLIFVSGLSMVGVIGVNQRIFSALANNGISVFMVAQTSSESSTSIGVRDEDVEKACHVLDEEFAKEIQTGAMFPMQASSGLATVAVVGESMKNVSGVAGKLFGTLGRNGINVIACAQGVSQTNISFVVESAYLRKTLNVIHDSFFLSEYRVLNLFLCGVGTVGGSLIEQIAAQREKLMKEKGLKLNVVGIASSRNALFDRKGLSLTDYKERLRASAPSTLQHLRDEIINMNIY